jgi:predicted RND superfamily exporter protein
VIGVATVIHIVVRFREMRGEGLLPRDSLVISGGLLAVPVLWSCLTDAAGFGSLLAARVGPVQDFGTMMVAGSLLVLLAVAVFLPGLALGGGVDADPKRAWGERGLDVGLRRLLEGLLRWPKTNAAASLAASGVAAAGCYWLEVESDFTRNFRRDSPIVSSYEFVESRLGGAGVWDVVVPTPDGLDLDTIKRIRKLEQRLREEVVVAEDGKSTAGLTKVLSMVDALDASPFPPDRLPAAFRSAGLRVALRSMESQVAVLYHALLGENPQSGRQYARIMLRARERQPSSQKQQIIDQVRRISREEFPEAEVTGFFVLLTSLVDSMLRDQWFTFGMATLAIWLMMLLVFRSLALSAISLVPNVLPILVVTGLMGWLGWKINMGAAMIAAVSIGLSVDSSVHYLVSFARLRRNGRGVDHALHQVHQTVGRAMVFSTLALIVGFTALVQSQFVPTIYFGVLVSLAMFGGLLGNLVVLPLLLKLMIRSGS